MNIIIFKKEFKNEQGYIFEKIIILILVVKNE